MYMYVSIFFVNTLLQYELIVQALSNIRETAEQMVSVIHSALKSFEILQASLIGKVDTEQVRVHDEAVIHVHVYMIKQLKMNFVLGVIIIVYTCMCMFVYTNVLSKFICIFLVKGLY